MDDILPSYESVISRSPWEFIPPYLDSNDLCSAALVCHKWHRIFASELWGDPGSHFSVPNDTVHVALIRFKRSLFWARAATRGLTHTLDLPQAQDGLFGDLHAEWLRDFLERLPRLQALSVNGQPFFDHSALLTLRHPSLWFRRNYPDSFSVYGLRLLCASRCSNATATGLSEALSYFPHLVFLDLSKTIAAKHESVLRKLKSLPTLRILKLAGLGLKDSDFQIVASAIGIRVRSLDISDNDLTDKTAGLLAELCFTENALATLSPVEDGQSIRDTEVYETVDLSGYLRNKLTQGFIGSLAVENTRLGVTHLCLSGNPMTSKGITELLRMERLQALDIGSLTTTPRKPQNTSLIDDDYLNSPGFEDLTPILWQYAAERLKYLRIKYTIVTADASFVTPPLLRVEVEGDSTPYIADRRQRLDQRYSQENRLHPGMLPKLQTLVLTGVPVKTNDRALVRRLKQFVIDCAEEMALAKLRARHTYMLPPRRSRAVAENEYARSRFALRRIVLEMSPEEMTTKKGSSTWRPTQSSTEDDDSEAFWEAAAHDFSFFGDEECDMPDFEADPYLPPTTAMSGIVLDSKGDIPPPSPSHPGTASKQELDVVSEIAQFRNDRRAAYQDAIQKGETDPIVEGYWPGEVTVVRKPRAVGSLDYYGNQYESGWLYR